MAIGLEGKVVLVTGASRGIGAAAAKLLAAQGAAVALNYLASADKAEALAGEIEKAGGKAAAFQADVRDRAAVDKMVAGIEAALGPVDVLVNNANIRFAMKPFTEQSWQDIRGKIDGEIGSLYNCSQAVLKGMLSRGSGKLIFVSSGLSRHPGPGFAAHCAAKAAVDSLARVMALELGPKGVAVNVVGPGLVRTDATAGQPESFFEGVAAQTPLRRVCMPEDIAGTIAYLASDLSSYVTGVYVPVNGGMYMP